MDVFNKFCGTIFIFLVTISGSIHAEDACLKKGPCSCEFSNGTGIDLSESAGSSFYTAQYYEVKKNGSKYELSTYYYHPCYDITAKLNASSYTNTCSGPLSICRFLGTMDLQPNATATYKMVSGSYDYMGSSNVTNFTTDGRFIIYDNGPSKTMVLLVCAETEDNLEVYSLEDPNKVVLAFYSRNACLKQIEAPGRSFGSTLCIIFFSFVIFYLVLGICTKKFLMGATGVEIIPNLGFWTDLPNLVKDGWAFTVNGFKLPVRNSGPATSPDPNSYDSI